MAVGIGEMTVTSYIDMGDKAGAADFKRCFPRETRRSVSTLNRCLTASNKLNEILG